MEPARGRPAFVSQLLDQATARAAALGIGPDDPIYVRILRGDRQADAPAILGAKDGIRGKLAERAKVVELLLVALDGYAADDRRVTLWCEVRARGGEVELATRSIRLGGSADEEPDGAHRLRSELVDLAVENARAWRDLVVSQGIVIDRLGQRLDLVLDKLAARPEQLDAALILAGAVGHAREQTDTVDRHADPLRKAGADAIADMVRSGLRIVEARATVKEPTGKDEITDAIRLVMRRAIAGELRPDQWAELRGGVKVIADQAMADQGPKGGSS